MDKYFWIKQAYYKGNFKFTSNKISEEDFLYLISQENYNLLRDIPISRAGLPKMLKRIFPNRPSRGGIKVCTWLLSTINKKQCSKCKIVKDYEDFYENHSKATRLNDWCKSCFKVERTKNPFTNRAAVAKYKANKLRATPKWLTKKQLNDITEIYQKCPIGYHVDHIVPLQGTNICGLHVPWNLQYLPAKENMSKGNKLTSASLTVECSSD